MMRRVCKQQLKSNDMAQLQPNITNTCIRGANSQRILLTYVRGVIVILKVVVENGMVHMVQVEEMLDRSCPLLGGRLNIMRRHPWNGN